MSLFSIARLTSNVVRLFSGRKLFENGARTGPKPDDFQSLSGRFLFDFCSISGRNLMSDTPDSVPHTDAFEELAGDYPPKLSRKFRLLLPLKAHIEGLLAKRASYDDIRILLAKANVTVSKNTIYRFCREVIGQKQVRQPQNHKGESQPIPPVRTLPSAPPTNDARTIEAALQEQRSQRERLPGLWGRRKRGPRIADSKNL
jgi:hypothetical protein